MVMLGKGEGMSDVEQQRRARRLSLLRLGLGSISLCYRFFSCFFYFIVPFFPFFFFLEIQNID